ncbi:MAG TPA: LexA family transcriptional regulator [Terracidiphilus sp.]|jgi:transcriptional regulator with XRE-family HTH domain|nr:LexA family transcriptional regulator [Terracidiphilus sp.]
MPALKSNPADWADRIRRLLAELKLSQAGLAERLGVSPPTVSRWISGWHEPTAESYIALGNLAQPPDGIYFWERAGLDSGLLDASFQRAISSLRVSLREFKLVAGRKVSGILAGKGNAAAVAIPRLNVTAYGDRVPPHENVSLSEVKVLDILLAPLAWCPHPENMIAIHLSGDSMLPLIPSGSILFVDTATKDRERLHQRIALVSHRDLGFKVARFQKIAGTEILVSANHKYAPIDVSNASKWRIFGEVLWWVSRDAPEG